MQEEYIKDEQKNLKKEYLHAQEEVKRIQSVPLVIGQFLEAVDQNTGIVGSTTGKDTCERIKLFCILGNFAGLLVFANFIQTKTFRSTIRMSNHWVTIRPNKMGQNQI